MREPRRSVAGRLTRGSPPRVRTADLFQVHACPFAPDSRPARPAISTSAASARRCSTGCSPAGTAGQFILRIDDTDRERNVEAALRPILEGFRWLGIDWDEGPEVGGPCTRRTTSRSGPGRYRGGGVGAARAGAGVPRLRGGRGDGGRAGGGAAREAAVHLQPALDGGDRRRRGALRGRGTHRRRAAEDAARGRLPLRRPGARTGRLRLGARAGPRHPAGGRQPSLPPGQRGRRPRLRASPTSSAPRSICRTRRGRSSSPTGSATSGPATPTCPTWRRRAAARS